MHALTGKAQSNLGRVHEKSIKVNYYELAHQNLLIKWICKQTDTSSYQIEGELKIENGNLNAYSYLIIIKNDNIEIYV